jgi:hypothetical protein
MIDRRPALIARCIGVADVVRAVRFARAPDREFHCAAAAATSQGWRFATAGLMIDLSLQRGVWVDAAARTRAGAGRLHIGRRRHRDPDCRLATVLGFRIGHRVAGLTGAAASVTLRKHGWTCDNLI